MAIILQTKSVFDNIAFNYNNIILKHNKGIAKSRKDCNISTKIAGKWLSTPVFLSNMGYLQTDFVLKTFNERKWGYIYHRLGGPDNTYNFLKRTNEENWYLKSICVGIQEYDLNLLRKIKEDKLDIDILTIDVAFIYNEMGIEFIKKVRDLFPNIYLIAGNFDSVEAAQELEKLGVNCGKINIGVSKKCFTRQRTGFGSSTISDINNCKINTNKLQYLSDGGLEVLDNGEIAIGDIFKCLNFGGNFILSSALFQNVQELSDKNGNILCYGNSTARAKGHDRNEEGIEFYVKTHGRTLEQQMNLIEDSLRSSCSYAGINDVKNAYNSCNYQIIL